MKFGDFYDREGNPIEMMQWAELRMIPGYIRIAQTELPNGRTVSTVWLGLDHGFFGDGPPLIFETMVFGCEEERVSLIIAGMTTYRPDEGQWRYTTEVEALAGHEAVVAQLRGHFTVDDLVGKETADGAEHLEESSGSSTDE